MAAPTPPSPWIDWTALWQIVVVGLIAGAGLPALFAVGLRALAIPGRNQPALATGGSVDGPTIVRDSTEGSATVAERTDEERAAAESSDEQEPGAEEDRITGGSPVGMVLAAICFLIVLAAIGWGIDAIWVAGHPS